MYKINLYSVEKLRLVPFSRLFRIMKITVFLLFFGFMHVYAASHGQTVSLKKQQITYRQLLKELSNQTGYDIMLHSSHFDLDKLVSVDFKNVPLSKALGWIKGKENLDFEIIGKDIVLHSRDDNKSIVVQNKRLTGVITDKNNKPIAGATVKVKGTKKSVSSNDKGEFLLVDVSPRDVLQISMLGYQGLEIPVNSQSTISVILIPQSMELEEIDVINTGYQRIRRENMVGAVVSVGSEELEKRNAVNILNNLEGKVPGLVLYNGNVTVRGVSTLQASRSVLVVVDGLPIEGGIEDLNPYDVENITVLKDAAAAAIYGARASNGVIVVTTKRAKIVGKTTVEYASNVTVQDKEDYSYRNLMTAKEQVEYERKYSEWWFNGGGGKIADPITQFENRIAQGGQVLPVQYAYYKYKTDPSFGQDDLENLLSEYSKNDFLADYSEHALNKNVLQQHNLALRTNNGKSQSNLVISYRNSNGKLINAFDRQLNLFYKGDYKIGDWLDVNYGVNSVIGKRRSHASTYATDPFNVPRYLSLFNPDGSRSDYRQHFNIYNNITEVTTGLFSARFNHLDELERDYQRTTDYHTRYFVNLNVKLLSGLTFRPMFQYEDERVDQANYSEEESYRMRWLQNVYTNRTGSPGAYTYTNRLPKGGMLRTVNRKGGSYTTRGQLDYVKDFGKHKINALSGVEFRQTRYSGTKGLLLGYDEQLQLDNTNNVNFKDLFNVTTTFLIPGYTPQQYDFGTMGNALGLVPEDWHRFASAYANATYTYDNKYNLFGSVRKDYADLFGGDKKYRGRPLWSIGGSWVASNEEFIRAFDFVNFLNVRASFGLTGNMDPYTTSVLTAATGLNRDTRLPNAYVSTPPNPQLRWEKTETTNLGLDFSLFENRLKGNFDWYRRKGSDLLAQKRMDPSEGFTTMVINNGALVNNGFEFSIGYDWFRPTQPDDFFWTSNVVLSHNKNKITYVDKLTVSPFTVVSGGAFREGYPVRSLFSYPFAGLNTEGLPEWFAVDGSKIDAPYTTNDIDALIFSGSADPTTNIGFNNEVSYKGLSLSIYAVYYGGHFLRAAPMPKYELLRDPIYSAMPNYLLQGWTPTNTDTYVPGTGEHYQESRTITQYNYADIAVRPADFIKIRNIALGYNLPKQWSSKIAANRIGLRFQINNPRNVWEKQKDIRIDPSTGGAPIPTSYVFGLNINF